MQEAAFSRFQKFPIKDFVQKGYGLSKAGLYYIMGNDSPE
jgi:hypothetical protein